MPRKYNPTKLPNVQLCSKCRRETTKKSGMCTPCENTVDSKERKRSITDYEYREAYKKHALKR